MARSSNKDQSTGSRTARTRAAFRVLLSGVAAMALAIAIVLAVWQVEHFLLTDRRFVLEGPPDAGDVHAHFTVDGLHYATHEQVAQVFARDFGRSVHLCPIERRRLQLLSIDWVRDASVSRIWPNRIAVQIEERKPVAFVQLPVADGTMRYSLIDRDGVMLNPHRATRLKLPVLTGLLPVDSPALRRERVRKFLKLEQELATLLDEVSEIDVGDTDNVKVTQVIRNCTYVLMLGSQQFRQRLEAFLKNEEAIRERLPGATILDLRLKDRITAVGGASRGC